MLAVQRRSHSLSADECDASSKDRYFGYTPKARVSILRHLQWRLHSLDLEAALPHRASEPIDLQESANDTHAFAEVLTLVPHKGSAIQQKLEQFLSQVKHSAQAEWELLWYHGVVSEYQKIAHHFPELESQRAEALIDHSVSEPTLGISSLSEEEQGVFKQETIASREPFAPSCQTERIVRISRAQKTSDSRQRLALLLSLPTFHQYSESKRRIREEISRALIEPSRRQLKRGAKFALKREKKQRPKLQPVKVESDSVCVTVEEVLHVNINSQSGMSHQNSRAEKFSTSIPVGRAEHRPLVVGLTKPQSTRSASTMASSSEAAALNEEIQENIKENTNEAAPLEDQSTVAPAQKPKKEKVSKQPKAQKAAPPTAPTTPALIDLRVGHILRAIAHPNADSLYVSTIAMGDSEGTEHTQVDEETGKIVRTVCSGLNGLVPLEEMQSRKVVVVANLKPVNMRSIKSAAMVLAASPKQPEGADPHAADRVVELVSPPDGAEAGDKVYFEGWPYGEGKGPEKTLNPKKKQWEAIQPGFYTTDDLIVGFDASQCEEVESSEKGNLVVEGKGVCKVKTLKGAVVR